MARASSGVHRAGDRSAVDQEPLSTKNMESSAGLCREVVANAGVDTKRPLAVQVSRFDPWKDPMGVIDAYRRAKLRVLAVGSVGCTAHRTLALLHHRDVRAHVLVARVPGKRSTDPSCAIIACHAAPDDAGPAPMERCPREHRRTLRDLRDHTSWIARCSFRVERRNEP